MEIKNINEELSTAKIDEKANIKLVKLSGDASLSIFAAEVSPMSSLNPHYHKNGIETYQVYSGSGIMKTGIIAGISVEWQKISHVVSGDFFTIQPHTIHQVINNTNMPLVLIFACQAEHLASDRFFIQKELQS